MFEGMTSIRAAIDAAKRGDRSIIRVLYDEKRKKARDRELSFLFAAGSELGFDVVPATKEEIDGMTLGSSHGGVVALCSGRTIPPLDTSFIRENGFYVLIEGIEDPYNFGYAVRSIWASGADGIVLPGRNWMSAAGVVCRSSAGASERIPMAEAKDAFSACSLFKERGYRIVSAGIRDSVSACDADLSLPILLVIGGEKRGISRATLDISDLVVRIDYGREFRGSLSTASAATVLAFEVLRQNK